MTDYYQVITKKVNYQPYHQDRVLPLGYFADLTKEEKSSNDSFVTRQMKFGNQHSLLYLCNYPCDMMNINHTFCHFNIDSLGMIFSRSGTAMRHRAGLFHQCWEKIREEERLSVRAPDMAKMMVFPLDLQQNPDAGEVHVLSRVQGHCFTKTTHALQQGVPNVFFIVSANENKPDGKAESQIQITHLNEIAQRYDMNFLPVAQIAESKSDNELDRALTRFRNEVSMAKLTSGTMYNPNPSDAPLEQYDQRSANSYHIVVL